MSQDCAFRCYLIFSLLPNDYVSYFSKHRQGKYFLSRGVEIGCVKCQNHNFFTKCVFKFLSMPGIVFFFVRFLTHIKENN